MINDTLPNPNRITEVGDLFELRNTKLPRHHRDAEDAMHWAADEIERLRAVLKQWQAYDDCDEADHTQMGPMFLYADAINATRKLLGTTIHPEIQRDEDGVAWVKE